MSSSFDQGMIENHKKRIECLQRSIVHHRRNLQLTNNKSSKEGLRRDIKHAQDEIKTLRAEIARLRAANKK